MSGTMAKDIAEKGGTKLCSAVKDDRLGHFFALTGRKRQLIRQCIVLLFSITVIAHCGIGLAAQAQATGESALIGKYPTVKAKLEKNQFGAPIYLESAEVEDSLRVEMYGVFNHPFPAVSDALQSAAGWCEITPLHLNIKACTSRQAADQSLLTLYSGHKYYQPPADAYPLAFTFRVVSHQPSYLAVTLSADEGPLSTKDHRIRLEAVPLGPDKTFVHFSYAYRTGKIARMAIKSYFATLARDKVGFSVVAGKDGTPVYIAGVRGAIERNAVRYYLAVETYMDTLKYPEARRFEQRINRWYDLTAMYPRQLRETDKNEYLSAKRRERGNQLAQQKKEGR